MLCSEYLGVGDCEMLFFVARDDMNARQFLAASVLIHCDEFVCMEGRVNV